MKNHLEKKCDRYEIACPFGECGCEFKSVRTDMPKHLRETPGIHLNLMNKALGLQRSQIRMLTEVVEKQRVKMFDVANKFDVIEKLHRPQIIWKIDNYLVRIFIV